MARKCVLEGTYTEPEADGTVKVLLACQRRGDFVVLIHESSKCLVLDPDDKPVKVVGDGAPVGDMQIDKESSLEEYQTYARLHQIDFDGRWGLDKMREHLCRNFTKFR